MKLTPNQVKNELIRYTQQKEALMLKKHEWSIESYTNTKNFYDEKIEQFRSLINKEEPKWLHNFDKNRADAITVVEGNEITRTGIKVLG